MLCFHRLADCIGVDTVFTVKFFNIATLTEALDAERADLLSTERAEPGQCRGMAVQDRHQLSAWWQPLEQFRNVGSSGTRVGPIE